MNRMIAWWAGNHVAANLLMIGIVIAGILGYFSMDKEFFPLVSTNRVEITVIWPGAAPQEVEEQIILKIEESLQDLDNVDRIQSTAAESYGQIRVDASAQINMMDFLDQVKSRVDSVNSLPRDIERPQIRRTEYRQEMIRVAVHGDLSERELNRLAEDLRDEIAELSYISIVDLFGVRREEVSIELSEQSMRRYGLTFTQVASAIRSSSINLSSGSVRTETGDVLLRARNMADSQEDFENIIVRQSADGGIVRVGDVARVLDGYEENEILATINGESAVLVQIMSTENLNVVKASDSVEKWLVGARERMPEGVTLSIWFDSSDLYESRMETLGKSSFYGLILVFIILMLSLRPTVALWVTGGIAVAFVGSFILLPGAGVSINVLSTFAFLLVLGIVVDDAIVVGESIHEFSEKNGGGLDSAVAGAQAVAKPVVFAVLTTMTAFMPWFFLTGDDVQLTRQITVVIVAALLISLVEALFILPAHLRQLGPRRSHGRFIDLQSKVADGIVSFARGTYRRSLDLALDHRYLTTSIFIMFFVISMGVFSSGWVKFSFMPEIDGDQIFVNVEMPVGSPYSRALEVLAQLQEAELALEAEVNASAVDGEGVLVEQWYTRSRRENVLALVKLAPPEERHMTAKDAANRLRELVGDIPDAENIQVASSFNDDGDGLSYSITHDDLDSLRLASNELQQKLSSYSDVYNVRDNLQGTADELHLSLLPGAEKLGVTLAELSRQVRQAYYGEEVQRLPRENGDVKVMVRYPKSQRDRLASLADFRVRTADGRELPLMSVAQIELSAGVNSINRRDGHRSAYISAELAGDIMDDIITDMDENYIPGWKARHPGVEVLKGGQAESEEEFFREVGSLYLVAFFIMYALIAVAFRSYWLPLIVMTAIPFGFMGAVYGHLIFGVTMALFSYFGIGAAAGVVVNDNLVLLDYVQKLREKGMDAREAMVQAGVQRFRPILLTTVTTFVGLIPMMAEQSEQAQFLHPAVIALAFGVLFALFVSLLMVPSLYLMGDDASRGWIGLKAKLGMGPKVVDSAAVTTSHT
ncbi:MAG: multidrug efflux pump subunit AcrB [Halieaceae bacterium]|jgi:multidrug efflux pump subunit AcrB